MLHLLLMLNTMKILMKTSLNLRLVIVSEFQNTKTFLLKDTSKIGVKKFLLLAKLKTVSWTYVISDLNGEPIAGSFYEKELQKPSQEKFRIENVIKRKGDKLHVKWKRYDSCCNKTFYKNESILS